MSVFPLRCCHTLSNPREHSHPQGPTPAFLCYSCCILTPFGLAADMRCKSGYQGKNLHTYAASCLLTADDQETALTWWSSCLHCLCSLFRESQSASTSLPKPIALYCLSVCPLRKKAGHCDYKYLLFEPYSGHSSRQTSVAAGWIPMIAQNSSDQ